MTKKIPDTRPALRTLAAAVFLTALAMLAYANAFEAPFVLDDRQNILENPYIRMTELTPEILTRIWESPSASRPLANLSFAADFFFHQYDVRGYHVVNLIVHIITALLVWLVTQQTMILCHAEERLVPFFAAALWLVNPLHTESVTYIVQRMNSLATMFYLLSLLCYGRARINAGAGGNRLQRLLLYALCLTAAVLGLASKEIVVTLPAVLLLYEWFFFQNLGRAWLKKQLLWMGLAALAIIVLALLYMGTSPLDKFRSMYGKQNFTMAQRLLTEPGVVIYYISLLLFPHPDRLTLDYDFPVSHALTDPVVTSLALTALAMMIIAALRLARKHRLLSFAVLWFLLNLAVESSFIGLYLIYEHRTYLPSIFPFIGLVWLILSHIRPKALAVTVLCLAISIGGLWTYRRNTAWTDAVLFWQNAVEKAPEKARPYSNLGFSLLLAGKTEEAIAPLSRGLELDPLFQDIHSTIAIACHLTGQSEKALEHCRTALKINPDFIEARNTMGFILREQGKLEQAEACFNRVLTKAPDNFEAMMNMGLINQQRGDNENALPWFQKAAGINPVSSKGLYHLGACLALCDRIAEAVDCLEESLRLDPDDHLAHCALAGLLEQRQETGAASSHYERTLEIAPDCAPASINLARLRLRQGETAKALSCLNEAAEQAPENSALLWRIVQILTGAGEFQAAAGHLERLARLHPDNPKLLYNLACLYARQDDKGRAVEKLQQALGKGYRNWLNLQTDKDLENIRDTEYYRKLIAGQPER